eukprot:g9042.t1
MLPAHSVALIILKTLIVLFMLDGLLQMETSWNKSTRWFLLHFLVNMCVSYLVIPDMVVMLQDPTNNGLHPDILYNDSPLAITVGLHVYHCFTSYKTMTIVDWMHHLVSNMLVCVLCFSYHYGPLVSWGCFFVCGFPGGIDYGLLFLKSTGWIHPMTEKRWNRGLNMWVRSPGIMMFIAFAYCSVMAGKYTVPLPVLLAQFVLNAVNAIYFADLVVANAAICEWCHTHGVDKKQTEEWTAVKEKLGQEVDRRKKEK